MGIKERIAALERYQRGLVPPGVALVILEENDTWAAQYGKKAVPREIADFHLCSRVFQARFCTFLGIGRMVVKQIPSVAADRIVIVDLDGCDIDALACHLFVKTLKPHMQSGFRRSVRVVVGHTEFARGRPQNDDFAAPLFLQQRRRRRQKAD